MRKGILYIVGASIVAVLLIGCESFRYHKKAKIEVADWIGLTAGEKKASSKLITTARPTLISGDSIVQACWAKEVDANLPAYIKDMVIDSICCEIENLDSLNDVELHLYVSEDSIGCQALSSATIIAIVNLEPGEQIVVNGQNFHRYFSNLDLLVDIVKDGHFWAYAEATAPMHVDVGLSSYTFYVTLEIGLF